MERRYFFSAVIFTGVNVIATMASRAAHSNFWWPGYRSASKPTANQLASLRKHLRGDPHYFFQAEIEKLSDTELLHLHDAHHLSMKTKNKPPMQRDRNKPLDRSVYRRVLEERKKPPEKKKRKIIKVLDLSPVKEFEIK